VFRLNEAMIRAGGLCVLALMFGYSGWRALRRQPIWIPDVSDDLHRTAGLDAGGTWVTERWLRPVGLGLVLLAVACLIAAAVEYF